MTLNMSERYILYPLLRFLGHQDKASLLAALSSLESNTKDDYIVKDIRSLSKKLERVPDAVIDKLREDAMTDDLRAPGPYKIDA